MRVISTVEEFVQVPTLGVVIMGIKDHPEMGGVALQHDRTTGTDADSDTWLVVGQRDQFTSKALFEGTRPEFVGFVVYEGIDESQIESWDDVFENAR